MAVADQTSPRTASPKPVTATLTDLHQVIQGAVRLRPVKLTMRSRRSADRGGPPGLRRSDWAV